MSQTGLPGTFSPCRNSPPQRLAAIRPASRAILETSSSTGDDHPFGPDCRNIDPAAMFQVVGGHQGLEHIDQVSRDGDFGNRRRDFTILDEEAGGAAAIVAGHRIDALPDKFRHVDTPDRKSTRLTPVN